MVAAELILSTARGLFDALKCSNLKEILSMYYCQSELESLKRSISTIKSLLLCVESNYGELSSHQQAFIKKLKDDVRDAEYLLDDFAIAAHKHQLRIKGPQKAPKKVRELFSGIQKLPIAYSMSKEVQNIRKKLKAHARDASKCGFKVDYRFLRRKEQPCVYVSENVVIGREYDKRRIVDLLIDPNFEGRVPVFAIVGMGGLGKTTLAKIVFNDPTIREEFPLRLWVNVSDFEDPFTIRGLLVHIFKSATGQKHDINFSLDALVQQVRNILDQSNYLLVLDDVWNDDHLEWRKLVDILMGSFHRENKILVTTRSVECAYAAGSGMIYELRGLSDEDAWRLFEMTVGRAQANRHELVEIAKDIVKKCANVPLAIKMVGRLLYGQDEKKWRFFRQCLLTNIGNDLMQILKLSYDHLSPSLKCCLAYCTLFPTGFIFEKEMLVNLWMAQDYIQPLQQHQSVEEAAEDHFQILVQRCFFQDVQEQFGTVTFTIHDLIHDMAQALAGKEILSANSEISSVDKTIRWLCPGHLYDRAFNSHTIGFVNRTKIPACITYNDDYSERLVKGLVSNQRSLRALDLSALGIRRLPDEIGQLMHLMHLDLSMNVGLEMLPASMTKLINLQTLNLHGCESLKELPEDFSKLSKLRTLYIYEDALGYGGLSYMPLGMAKLTSLNRLNKFVVSQETFHSKQQVGGLQDLRALRHLRGYLRISIARSYKHAKEHSGRRGYLYNLQHLNSISLQWPLFCCEENEETKFAEDLLEDLQPHCNLRSLEIIGYQGVTIPTWAKEGNLATSLPNLVKIVLEECHGLQDLPWLGELTFLKILELRKLENLEYVENGNGANRSSCEGPDGTKPGELGLEIRKSSVFPSLEVLRLESLPKLKGWCREDDNKLLESKSSVQPSLCPSFPRLYRLTVKCCPALQSILLCPMLKKLCLSESNERLQIVVDQKEVKVQQHVLEGLRVLRSLKGPQAIWTYADGIRIYWEAASKNIRVSWEHGTHIAASADYPQVSPEDLQLLYNLRGLEMDGYHGVRIPRWVRDDNLATFLPNLVRLVLVNCHGVQELPWLSKLVYLKMLVVNKLSNLEYMESTSGTSCIGSYRIAASKSREEALASLFFPSLEELELGYLPKLKGWWRRYGLVVQDDEVIDSSSQNFRPMPWFPCLSKLTIEGCPKLTFFPQCPSVKTLDLSDVNETLHRIVKHKRHSRTVSIKVVNDEMWDTTKTADAENLDSME